MSATQTDIAALKARMADLFASACKKIGISPLSTFFGHRSHACLATEWEARELATVLQMAGETSVDVYHWDPKKNPDFERDEYQVSWGASS